MSRSRLQFLIQPVSDVVHQVPRALVVSCMAAALDMGLLVGLVEFAGWNPLLAATVSYLVGGILQYFLCCVWVFSSIPDNVSLGFAAFTLLSLAGLGITWGTLNLSVNYLGMNYVLAKILALGFAFVWNFTSRKYLLFNSVQ